MSRFFVLVLSFLGTLGVVTAFAQDISGIVVDRDDIPVIGATVTLKNQPGVGTITDMDGIFTLKAPKNATMVISYVGMETQEITIDDRTFYRVILLEDVELLQEVVVTGYQTIPRERATGAYAILSEEDLTSKINANILDQIEGMVPGLLLNGDNFLIRGVTTINGVSEPLIIVDGMPYEGDISLLSPSNITNVTVLKDAAASSIYGARAANGVIVIQTQQGTKDGKIHVHYDGSIKINPIPAVSGLNLTNSAELVKLQEEGFAYHHTAREAEKYFTNPILSLLYDLEAGDITRAEYDRRSSEYGQLDNRSQIETNFLRSRTNSQHNLLLRGGAAKNNYSLSLNYLGELPHNSHAREDQLSFGLRNHFQFFNWLNGNIGIDIHNVTSEAYNGVSNPFSLYTDYPSYYMLQDKSGASLPLPQLKSRSELDRLIGLGLEDEAFYPMDAIEKEKFSSNRMHYRFNFGLNFKFNSHLNADLKYQRETGSLKSRQDYADDSYYVRSMVNNAAQVNGNVITYNVPLGSQLSQVRGDHNSYTLRTQLNYDNIIADTHLVTALAGAEVRAVKNTQTTNYYMGYDDNTLQYKTIDAIKLKNINGTQSLSGRYAWDETKYNTLDEDENRYISFYSVASYVYDNRYTLTGSVRVDQSNLFGTDPKYRYRPLWSIGSGWRMANEAFMSDVVWINALTLRLTYGIGGNVPRGAGPYLTVRDAGLNPFLKEYASRIQNPPNPTLRWEKTTTTNFGVDFSVLNNRLFGSLDLYFKKTTDLLDLRNSDPTIGWSSTYFNYGSMDNKGMELALNSRNIKTADFSWDSRLNLSLNKNELLNLKGTPDLVFDYISEEVRAVGYPMGSIFSYSFAGLNPEDGWPMVYNADGEKVRNVTSTGDLVYSGTTIPTTSASLVNTLSYKDFSVLINLVYYGGHVMRGVAAPWLKGAPETNVDKSALNYWKKPGDESQAGIAPAMNFQRRYTEEPLWYSSDIHVVKANYMKIRNITFTYNLPRRLIEKALLSAASIQFQMDNVGKWVLNDQKLDPEATGTRSYNYGARLLPIPATYSFGLSVDF
jgi:TonB-linked SusC/RagA family outer membrane protein